MTRLRGRRSPFLITALAAAPTAARAAGAEVSYRVAMPDPRVHEFEVEMTVPALPNRPSAELVFPAWTPGSYLVRDFARHIYGLAATDPRGRPVGLERLDKQRWRVASGGGSFRVRYRVFAFEIGVRTSFLDDTHGYFNGANLFFYVDGEKDRPCRLEVEPARKDWRVTTALAAVRGVRNTFRAASYDELVDSPVESGTHSVSTFKVGKTSFEMALYGRTNADPKRLVDDTRHIVEATGAIFGGFPFDRYVFIVHALPTGAGGLEHGASATLQFAGLAFEDQKAYHSYAKLTAHEFFHVWNVKRIRDAVLGPFDYTRENYTRLLWLHEGFTDTMAHLILLRAGIWRTRDYLRWLGEEWPKYASRPGRNTTPLSELSFEAWIKLYKPAENHTNQAVSYYEKGMWAGLVLDLMMRAKTGGASGLPELFRKLWDDHGREGRPITEPDVRAAARGLAGAPLDGFFDRYIHGLEELPVPDLLRRSGLEVRQPALWETPEPPPGGGEGDRDPLRDGRQRAWSGIALTTPPSPGAPSPNDRAVVKNVVPGSPAYQAGVTFGDDIVAVDGLRVGGGSFHRRIADRKPGDTVTVSYFRHDQLREAKMKLVDNPERKLLVKLDPKAEDLALAIRKGWLGE